MNYTNTNGLHQNATDNQFVIFPIENKLSKILGQPDVSTIRRVLAYRYEYPRSEDFPTEFIYITAPYKLASPSYPGDIQRLIIKLPSPLIEKIIEAAQPDRVVITDINYGRNWFYVNIVDNVGDEVDIDESILGTICTESFGTIINFAFLLRLIKDYRTNTWELNVYQNSF